MMTIYKIVTMTNWLPNLEIGSGPLYVRLAERIESDIGSGALPAGAKLPPQRDLAFDLGVTIGTVGRAYALARERGLVSGEVGRGTYVLGEERSVAEIGQSVPLPPMAAGTRAIAPPVGMLRMDSTAAPDVGQAPLLERLTGEIMQDRPDEIASYTRTFPQSWLEAGSRWLGKDGWAPQPSSIVPTMGAHAGVLAVIAAVTAPGDKIAFEELTYSSMVRSANLIGRRSVMVRIDHHGIDPDDFERVCAQQHPKVLFCVPTLHNPTAAILPLDRRERIVDIARRYNVWLIEDDIYGALAENAPSLLAELAPERTFLVGSISKAVAAGVRGGWVACPPHFAARVMTAHKMTTGGMPFLLAELAARLVMTGEARAIHNQVIAEIEIREAMARQTFAGLDFTSHKNAPFLWIKLPEPWLSGTFKNAAADEGVLIDDEDEFKAGRTEITYHSARIGFSALKTREQVQEGFVTLRRLLDSSGTGYHSYA